MNIIQTAVDLFESMIETALDGFDPAPRLQHIEAMLKSELKELEETAFSRLVSGELDASFDENTTFEAVWELADVAWLSQCLCRWSLREDVKKLGYKLLESPARTRKQSIQAIRAWHEKGLIWNDNIRLAISVSNLSKFSAKIGETQVGMQFVSFRFNGNDVYAIFNQKGKLLKPSGFIEKKAAYARIVQLRQKTVKFDPANNAVDKQLEVLANFGRVSVTDLLA